MIKTFQGTDEAFSAWHEAKDWCKEQGISVGSSCAMAPMGLLFGNYAIAKWRNLTGKERKQLHGTLEANRHGPATVRIKTEFEHLLKDLQTL